MWQTNQKVEIQKQQTLISNNANKTNSAKPGKGKASMNETSSSNSDKAQSYIDKFMNTPQSQRRNLSQHHTPPTPPENLHDRTTDNACHYTDYCSNGGSCSQDISGDLTCSCVGGWTGDICTEEKVNLCAENVDNLYTYWNTTEESTLSTLVCNGEYVGYVSRYCSSEGNWEEPNYSNCTSKSIQHIKEQTAQLLSGYSANDSVIIILDDLENITRNNNELRSGDLLTSSAVLNDIAKYVTNHTENLSVDQLEIFGSLCDNLLDERNHQPWEELNNEGTGGVTSLVGAVTEFTNAFTDVLDDEISLVVAKENIVIEVGKASLDEIVVPDRLKTSDSWISDSATEIKLKKNICSGLTGFSSTFYRNISNLFPKYLIQNG
ncbi:Hypothetical predicted protein [Mytilus galloprovincialis]|uniref:EGF-like domain-containing protein n=1 Tax=Mytilus galloprovincialis TaxID=29158 RepID=A0A8B6D7Q6_MYTGA|nr:Hypothetical predicted protein [Mytilus galloprovincialis]